MTVIGNYVVATGVELKVLPTRPEYHMWIVTNRSGRLQGCYADEYLAIALAKGLDRIDRDQISKEMDDILRSK